MFRKRWVYVLLLPMALLSGCALWQSEKTTVTDHLVKAISADLPPEWYQNTSRLLDSAWVCGSGKAGYAEPPVVPIGQVTKEKLYASAWTAALLQQANVSVSPDVLALLDPWLDQLVQQKFAVSDGYPKLHNLYLYYLLQTSLGKAVDKAVCLRELLQQIGNDPFSIEVLLQLAELHQAVGSRLTLPLMLIQELTSKRANDEGFSIKPDQRLEPQYTFKIQKLLLLVAGIHPEPTAARKAAQRFRVDSWYTTGPSQPNILDTYYGLAVSRTSR